MSNEKTLTPSAALANVKSLADEVEAGLFLPKRFRSLSRAEWAIEKPRYVWYLRKVEANLKGKALDGVKVIINAN